MPDVTPTTTVPTRCVRLHLAPDASGGRKRLDLELVSDGSRWLLGWEINRDGERGERSHLVDVAAITRRQPLVRNLFYGTLEVVK